MKRDTRILGPVQRHLMSYRSERELARDTAHVHPSEVCKADWCPRQTWFRITGEGESDPQEPDSFYLQNIFDEGHDIHDKWQKRLWRMGLLEGEFRCLVCHTVWWATAPERCIIGNCPAHDFDGLLEYAEVPIRHAGYHLLGHSDGLIEDHHGKALIEIKSVGKGTIRMEAPRLHKELEQGKPIEQVWADIKRPFATHLRQGMLYCFTTGIPVIIFLYELKANQQVKEFPVTFERRLIEPLLEACESLKHGLDKGYPPLRPDHATDSDSKVCRACPYRSVCWNLSKADPPAPVVKPTGVRRIPRPAAVA